MDKLFEDIMQENQPDCDMIYAYKEEYPENDEKPTMLDLPPDKHHKYYDVPETVPEEVSESSVEHDTIKMLRDIGIGPSLDEPLSSRHTLPSVSYNVPSTSSSIPLLIDSKFFELKPRKSESISPKCDEPETATGSKEPRKSKSKSPECNNPEMATGSKEPRKFKSKSPKYDKPKTATDNKEKTAKENENPKQPERRKVSKLAINFNCDESSSSNLEGKSSPTKPLDRKSNYSTPKEVYMKKKGANQKEL